MKALLCLFLLAPICLCANDFQQKYYPLNPGESQVYETRTQRVYTLPNGVDTMTLTGKVVETLKEPPEDYQADDSAFVIEQVVSEKNETLGTESHDSVKSVLDIQDDRLLLLAFTKGLEPISKAEALDPPTVIMDFKKMAAQEPYTSSLTLGGMKLTATVAEYDYVSIETPMGKFDDVLKVTMNGTVTGHIDAQGQKLSIQDGALRDTSWYAPGVGMIREENTMTLKVRLNQDVTILSEETKTKTLTAVKKMGK